MKSRFIALTAVVTLASALGVFVSASGRDDSSNNAKAKLDAQGVEAGSFDVLVRAIRAGYTYANVHTTRWPGGEIRGQIQ